MTIYQTMNMEPGYLLVELIEAEPEQLRNGIYVPTSPTDLKFQKATVVAVAHSGRSELIGTNTTVVFKQYVGYDMGEGYRVIEEKDILATIPTPKE